MGLKALRDLEPALSPEYRHAHYQPASAYVASPYRLVQALTQLFVRNGGKVATEMCNAIEPRRTPHKAADIKTAGAKHAHNHGTDETVTTCDQNFHEAPPTRARLAVVKVSALRAPTL